MFEAFSRPPLGPILTGLTYPRFASFLWFSRAVTGSGRSSIPSGNGRIRRIGRKPEIALFSFFTEGSCGPESVMFAMILRQAYLSRIWELPLAVPLTEIRPPHSCRIPVSTPRSTRQDPSQPSLLRSTIEEHQAPGRPDRLHCIEAAPEERQWPTNYGRPVSASF